MFFFNKYHKILILFLILSGCQLQEPNQAHGVLYLENRAAKLIVDKSNKNDIIRIIGQPQIINKNYDKSWIYVERVFTKGKYFELGKHKLEENNILVLNFDKYGILKKKELITKEDIKKLKFSDKKTTNDLSKESFVQSFLQSVKQKMYSNRGKTF